MSKVKETISSQKQATRLSEIFIAGMGNVRQVAARSSGKMISAFR